MKYSFILSTLTFLFSSTDALLRNRKAVQMSDDLATPIEALIAELNSRMSKKLPKKGHHLFSSKFNTAGAMAVASSSDFSKASSKHLGKALMFLLSSIEGGLIPTSVLIDDIFDKHPLPPRIWDHMVSGMVLENVPILFSLLRFVTINKEHIHPFDQQMRQLALVLTTNPTEEAVSKIAQILMLPDQIRLHIFHPSPSHPPANLDHVMGSSYHFDTVNGVPRVISFLTSYLSHPARLRSEGLFRLSAGKSQQLFIEFIIDCGMFSSALFTALNIDADAVSHGIKVWLRSMFPPSSPFFSLDAATWEMVEAADNKQMEVANAMLSQLSRPRRAIACYLFNFLHSVTQHESVNRMSANNLAIVFQPNMIPTENNTRRTAAANILDWMISHVDNLRCTQ